MTSLCAGSHVLTLPRKSFEILRNPLTSRKVIVTMSPEQPAVTWQYHWSGGQSYLLGCNHDSCIYLFFSFKLSMFSVTEGHPNWLLFLLPLPLPTLWKQWIEGSSKERQFAFTVQRDEDIKMQWKRVRACPKPLGFLHNTHSLHKTCDWRWEDARMKEDKW